MVLTASDSVLCPLPAGTANELCRALGYHHDPQRAFDAAASGRSRAVDLVRVQCSGLDGRPVDRFGYLIVAIGAAATISHRTSRSRWLKKLGEVAYLLMTPPVTLGYRQRDVAVTVDGIGQGQRRLMTAMIGNTENGGGGMKLVPGARFDDGVLDLIEMGGMSRFDALLRIVPRLYSGGHVHHPKVQMSRGTTFDFSSEVETLVDLDGETVGRLPLRVSVLPGAFKVGAP
jgi:diacylglycerol kinase family enzyme